jgi:DNA-directed RNA polymerase subunit RPC12/RpoP
MSKFWPFIGVAVLGILTFSVVAAEPAFAFAAIILSWPLILPAAGLGCHKCSYNILLPYRGAEYSEHGDSWTHPEVEPRLWRKRLAVPHDCPKCGAKILTSNSDQQAQNAQTH